MTDFRYSTGEELEEFLYEKCREDPDLLATIINEYVCSLSDSKLIELETSSLTTSETTDEPY